MISPGTASVYSDPYEAHPLSGGVMGTAGQPSGSDPGCKPTVRSQSPVRRQNQLTAGLHVVATPIGNLSDITDRARQTLAEASVVACEDRRVGGQLLRHLGVSVPLMSYHEHNADRMRPQIIDRIRAGDIVALIADAGTPLISDPGFKLVRDVRDAGLRVVPVPGASAVLTALVTAGLPTNRFFFVGFLPQKDKARRDTLDDVKAVRATLVFYESTRRLAESLTAMADCLGDHREAAVCRELTKLYEDVRRDNLRGLAQHYTEQGPPKGEAVVVVGPPQTENVSPQENLDSLIRDALLSGDSVRDVVSRLNGLGGLKKKHLYTRTLTLRAALREQETP